MTELFELLKELHMLIAFYNDEPVPTEEIRECIMRTMDRLPKE